MRLLTFCFRNLFRRKIRTILCILGVALATTFTVAIGAATMRYATVIKEMNVLFSGKVMVVSKDTIVIQAIPIGGGLLPQEYTLTKLQNISGVEKAIPLLFISPIELGGILQPVPVNFTMGIPVEDWALVLGNILLKGDKGHFPTNESSNEVVVGASLADQYNWTVGKTISIKGFDVVVSGILGTKLALLNRCVVMPLKLVQKIYSSYSGSVNVFIVQPSKGISQDDLAENIEGKVNYVKALTEEERNDMVQPVIAQIETWNIGLQTVVLLLSLILVMNVTMMNIAERRRDFATLEAIGAPLNYVFRIIILESAFIGFLGGAMGIFVGSLTALVLASLYSNIPLAMFFPTFYEIIPPLYALEMFVVVILICCAGGLIPAITATKMRIAEVLRAEY